MSQKNGALVPATSLIDVIGQFLLNSEPQFSLLQKGMKHPEMDETNKTLASGPTICTGCEPNFELVLCPLT